MKDYIYPDFENTEKVHDWKNYVTDEIVLMWSSFNRVQKNAIGEMLQDVADLEEWD